MGFDMRAHLDRFLRRLDDARGSSPHTVRAYRADVEQLAVFLERRGVEDPTELSTRHLRAWLGELDDRGLARSSIQRKLSSVRSFLRFPKDALDHPFAVAHVRRSTPELLVLGGQLRGLQPSQAT